MLLGYSLDLNGSEYYTIYLRNIINQEIVSEKIVNRLIGIFFGNNSGNSSFKEDSADLIHVLLLGYTYKEESKDLRESPALKIEAHLNEKGLITRKYDPLIDDPLGKNELLKLTKRALIPILLVKHKTLIKELDGISYVNWEDI